MECWIKGEVVMSMNIIYELPLSVTIHLLDGGVYSNCMNVKLLMYCERFREDKLCEVKLE